MTTLPLLLSRDLAAPLAWARGQAISAGQFIAEAQALAASLPEGRPVNLCQDRVHFALGLAAALIRGQTSLMPPNALPETLAQVPEQGGAPYLLIDEEPPATAGLRTHRVQRGPVAAPAGAVPQIPVDLEAVCLLTSGSTGAPQPHAKRWGPLVANIRAEADRLAEHLQQPSLQGLTLVATVPAQHSYGFESTVLLALLGGANFEAGRPFYPADIVDALARVPEPRALVTTPFHLKTLVLSGLPLPRVALTLSATAPLSPQLAAQAEAAFDGQLVEIYGCTEAGQVASRRTTAGETWQTLGELRISAEAAAEGERFIVAGGHVVEPTPLADVLVLQDSQANARQFKLLGRANDLIHVAGKRSSLAHLNFHLNRIPGVEDGAFWLPDDVAEGIVRTVAFVVAPTLTARDVITALREHLEPAFVPRRVVHVDGFPREATGKLTVASLRKFALETLARLDASAAEPTGDAHIHVAAHHPAFAGHFPGHPVLPGVSLLSLVQQALAQRPSLAAKVSGRPRIDNAKFLAPVGPGADLTVTFKEQGTGVAFEVKAGDTTVARGQFAPPAA
jgi:acyl-CoA synthetase (AMP-forming)/AMP-acid ligase II/3-hydroxymyristoyl/3-hydroxydecanoyl-(acyl carrier protein) dehydratase